MSTLWDVQCTGGKHEYTGGGGGGRSISTLVGYHDKCGRKSLGTQLNVYGNPNVLNIPQCTEHSWYT